MSEESAGKPKPNKWLRRIAVWVIGFFISLAIGWAAERVTDAETLASVQEAQRGWIDAVTATSPLNVAQAYMSDLDMMWNGHTPYAGYEGPNDRKGAGIGTPVGALVLTASRLVDAGGIAALVQLGLGALAFAVFNFVRTKGERIAFDNFAANLILGPLMTVVFASVIGLILQGVMLGALYSLSWVTGLAAAAAGATGVVGFCWFCVTKLGEKGAEHVLTPEA